jgi:hypothetical protein
MVKRFTSIFVLTIFLAHFAGFYVYFIFQINRNRQEMRARLQVLPAERLDVIALAPDKFKEVREDDYEMKIDGKMYDIARVEEREHLVLVYCLHDRSEDTILAFLDRVLADPLNDEQAPAGLIQFFSLTYIPTVCNFLIPHFSEVRSLTAYQEIQSSFCKKEIAPPPKV